MKAYEQESPIQRVTRMEAHYDRSYEAVTALLEAAQAYLEAKPALRELADYYQSPLWLTDYDAERADGFPKDMKRGILAEDAIYDLLTDDLRLRKLMEALLQEKS